MYSTYDVQYEKSKQADEARDNWIKIRTQEIIEEEELTAVFADYAESTYISQLSGVPLNRWGEYERALKAAIIESPSFRSFAEDAVKHQAERDFEEMVKNLD